MTNQPPDRRSRIAAQRAAARRTQTRNRLLLAGGAIVAVIVVIVVIVALQGHGSPGANGAPAAPTGAALTQLVGKVTGVPVATSDAVGTGRVSAPPKTISGTPLTSGGKPEVLYMGAEYCPYCAAERTAVEMQTNIPDSSTGGYTTLQTPTQTQQALLSKYDAAYQGAIPFLDLGNRYLSVGAS